MWKHKQTQSHSWDDWDKLGENNGMKIEDSGDFILNTVWDQLPKKVCRNGLQFHYKIQSHPTHGSIIQKYWARLNPAHFANLHLLDTDPSLNLFWLPTQKIHTPAFVGRQQARIRLGISFLQCTWHSCRLLSVVNCSAMLQTGHCRFFKQLKPHIECFMGL